MICMFDELLAFVAGMITASVRIKNPSPKIYAWAFVIGMAVIGVGFFLSLAISTGLLPALHLMGEKIFSPIGLGCLFLGGMLGIGAIWALSSRREI